MIIVEILEVNKKFEKLEELKRLELISMSRGYRYDSRTTKNIKYKYTNIDNIISGKAKYLDITLSVSNYEITLRFENFLSYIKQGLRKYIKSNSLLSAEYSSMTLDKRKSAITNGLILALDRADIRVNCSCPDFKYRYAYKATVNGYNFGFEEDRESKKTNPNLEGSTCKHLVGVLTATSKWKSKVIRDIRKSIDWDPTVLDI